MVVAFVSGSPLLATFLSKPEMSRCWGLPEFPPSSLCQMSPALPSLAVPRGRTAREPAGFQRQYEIEVVSFR